MLDKKYLKELIDSHSVVSFDIFDTLLLRPFMAPIDLFVYLETMFEIPNFAQVRAWTEAQLRLVKGLRKKGFEDITLDEIYSKMPQELSKYKETELFLEEKLLQPNCEMIEVFNYAKERNKTIIITSDMYIKTDILANILNKKGIIGFDKIYVSCDIKKTKASALLYDYILEDLAIEPQKLLHIGDNPQSDIEQAKSRNIDTFFYECLKNQFIKIPDNKKFAAYYNNSNRNLTSSIVLGLKILNWCNCSNDYNYYYKLGYDYGGILALVFAQEVLKLAQCRELTDVFFVARDGYILNEIFNIIAKDNKIKSHYIYASRKLRSLCLENEKTYDALIDKEYKKYINSLKLYGNKIGIVDSCAIVSYSAQNLVKKYLSNADLLGIYLVSNLNYYLDYINLSNTDMEDIAKMFNWNFIELLLSSKENSIIAIKDLKPVYCENNSNEKMHQELMEQIIQGERDFIKDFLRIFGNTSPNLDLKNILKYIANFWSNLNENDICNLSKIKHAGDIEQKEYKDLISEKEIIHV